METYTELTEALTESSSKVENVETEQVRALNEGVFFFENQAVLDRLSDNTNGELLYNQKVLAFKQEVDVVEYPSNEHFYVDEMGADVYEIVDNAEVFREGVKIKDIEFWYGEEWISINGMNRLDSLPYLVNMDRTYKTSAMVLAEVYFPLGANTIFTELVNNGIPQMRVHYVPLTAE